MKKGITTFIGMCMIFHLLAQETNQTNEQTGGAGKISGQLSEQQKIVIGGYGQIDYNQPISKDVRNNGNMDVHRLVLLFGYQFNEKLQLISEIEYEHVSEVFVEQAFLQYKLSDNLSLKGGLLLVPMGIINEYHEPPTFHGVERPNVDKYIVPTTWREIGAGISGRISNASVKYQLYVMNGFNGYDAGGTFSGKDGLRKGRQKGMESVISSPSLTGKIEYYGILGLKTGLSFYSGKSQSSLYDGLDKNNAVAKESADSSSVGIFMAGADVRYNYKRFQFRAQYVHTFINGAGKYNEFTGNDLGKNLMGYYGEVAYTVLDNRTHNISLTPFVRYEKYNTHHKVDGMNANENYNREEITVGADLHITRGAVVKADYQFLSTEAENSSANQLNLGVGFWF